MDICWHFNGNFMKNVLASITNFRIPTKSLESLNINTTYMNVSNFNNIKPLNKKLKVQNISLHIQSVAENSILLV
jgi:hypothetical protein